jgi:hypothetical protein
VLVPGSGVGRRVSAEQPVVFGAHDAAAFAGDGLQPGSVEHGDLAAAVADQPGPLERARGGRYARPVRAQLQREDLLGEREVVRPGAIVAQQEPAGAPLVDRVQAVAGGPLRGLCDERLGVAVQDALERAAAGRVLRFLRMTERRRSA